MTTEVHQGGPLDPAIIFDTMLSYQRSSALRAAVDLDLFRAIGEGVGDVPSLACRCEASERGIRILCDFLTIMELLHKEEGRYVLSPLSATFLDPRSPADMSSAARFLTHPMVRGPYEQLAAIVRQGRTVLDGQGSVEPDNPVWVDFARDMAPLVGPMAAPLASMVLAGLEGPLRVLDIAAGHGLFGIEVARRHPQATVVGLDWPAVLEVALENARKAGVETRYELRPGDAFTVEYGGPYDIVLLTNFLHHFDRATCVTLLKKVRAALRPGGKAAALEFVPNEDRVSPPAAAAFSLVMLATTAAGDAHTFRELEGMYREAGFRDITAEPVPMGPNTVVLGVA